MGTYTHENSVGIHIYDVDVTKGYMTERKVVPINNPSDLVVSRNRKFLYSIADEGVEAFKILKDGDLTICIFPYFCPYEIIVREIRESFI